MSIAIPSLRGAIAVPGWAKNELWRRARAVPSLDLRFAENRSLVDATTGLNLITFSRTSDATFVGSNGLIQTASAGTPRFDHSPITGESLGLLIEEQRTQILELTDTLATQTKTVAATAHTLSFYGTGTVVLSGAHSATVAGLGTYPTRTTLTFTPSAGNLTLTVSGSVRFAQLEAGVFATSYIPNSGTSQVTRAADVCSISGSNFSSWYRQDEGTVFADAMSPASGANRYLWDIQQQGSTANRIDVNINTSNVINPRTVVSGAALASLAAGSYAVSAPARLAFGFKAADYGSSLNGAAAVTTSTPGSLPSSLAEMFLGSLQGGLHLNGHIRRLVYWRERLANNVLQSITQ